MHRKRSVVVEAGRWTVSFVNWRVEQVGVRVESRYRKTVLSESVLDLVRARDVVERQPWRQGNAVGVTTGCYKVINNRFPVRPMALFVFLHACGHGARGPAPSLDIDGDEREIN